VRTSRTRCTPAARSGTGRSGTARVHLSPRPAAGSGSGGRRIPPQPQEPRGTPQTSRYCAPPGPRRLSNRTARSARNVAAGRTSSSSAATSPGSHAPSLTRPSVTCGRTPGPRPEKPGSGTAARSGEPAIPGRGQHRTLPTGFSVAAGWGMPRIPRRQCQTGVPAQALTKASSTAGRRSWLTSPRNLRVRCRPSSLTHRTGHREPGIARASGAVRFPPRHRPGWPRRDASPLHDWKLGRERATPVAPGIKRGPLESRLPKERLDSGPA